jgi:hypothetical protein
VGYAKNDTGLGEIFIEFEISKRELFAGEAGVDIFIV